MTTQVMKVKVLSIMVTLLSQILCQLSAKWYVDWNH